MPQTRLPASQLSLSAEGAAVLGEREGKNLVAYLDTRGILTIGIGHTSAAGPPKVVQGMKISENECAAIFKRDNARFRKEALELVTAPVTQYEFDALCSFLFNIGTTQFAGSTVLKRLNARAYGTVGEAMLWWNKPAAIRSRRKAEVQQFNGGRYVARIT